MGSFNEDAARLNSVGYGPEWSARWDAEFGQQPDTDAAADYLAELADGRPVLELGIGTGRLALPLVERGLKVTGVDNSPWMLEQLRAKPRADEMDIIEGDFGDVDAEGRFGLAFIARQTLFALTTQDRQIECFEHVAAQLMPGGRFVVEVLSPLSDIMENGRAWMTRLEPDRVTLITSTANRITQEMKTCYIMLSESGGIRLRPGASRYVYPSELDLMGRIAGMRLIERMSSWGRAPFTADSPRNISTYEKM